MEIDFQACAFDDVAFSNSASTEWNLEMLILSERHAKRDRSRSAKVRRRTLEQQRLEALFLEELVLVDNDTSWEVEVPKQSDDQAKIRNEHEKEDAFDGSTEAPSSRGGLVANGLRREQERRNVRRQVELL